MKPIKGLTLTAEEARGVQLYRELVQRRRREGHLRRYYAQVDAQWPDLDEETRHDLADSLFRQHMADLTRTQRSVESGKAEA